MKKPRVIVLVFSGEEPDEGVLATVAANISAMCDTDQVDPFVLNPKDIAECILHGIPFNTGEKAKDPATCKTPEDNAALFLGKIMQKELSSYIPTYFMSQLMEKISKAKKHPNNQLNREFMNALFILSQPNLNLSKSILEEVHLNQDRIAIIRDTYLLMQRYE